MTIRVNLQIFIFIALFYFTKQIDIYYTIMIFALLHELGHLIAGVFLGLKPKRLTILPYGVSVNFEHSIHNAKKELIVALAGPLINLFVILLCIIFKIYSELIIYSNIILFLFNLIPIYPLDGGRILKSVIQMSLGTKDAVIIINQISNITTIFISILGMVLTILTQNIAILLILIYLWILLITENKRYKFKLKMYEYLYKN